MRTKKKCQYSPSKVPTKLGYKGFKITDYFILVKGAASRLNGLRDLA